MVCPLHLHGSVTLCSFMSTNHLIFAMIMNLEQMQESLQAFTCKLVDLQTHIAIYMFDSTLIMNSAIVFMQLGHAFTLSHTIYIFHSLICTDIIVHVDFLQHVYKSHISETCAKAICLSCHNRARSTISQQTGDSWNHRWDVMRRDFAGDLSLIVLAVHPPFTAQAAAQKQRL